MPTHDLTVEHVPVGDLRTYYRNPRRGNTAVIAQSLKVNGQYRCLAVNRGTHTGRPNEVLAGNHTLMAARDLGWDTVAVTYVDVDDDQSARIVAADNRTADLGEYDDQLLLELLADLPDLGGTGYEPGDIEDLEKALRDSNQPDPGLTDPDDVPDPPLAPISKTGDVWLLGDHRLVVGKAEDPLVWESLLGDTKADCMWTDPPYGVSYVGKTEDALTIDNDELSPDELRAFLRTVMGVALVSCKPGAAWYVMSPPGPLHLVFGHELATLGVFRQTLVWVKDQFVMGHSDYHYRHEPIYYGWTTGAAHQEPPDRKQDTVFEVPRPKRSEDHPTMKPVELIRQHIENSCDRWAVVVDPFAGSGSTLIACHITGRTARLIEVDCRYADVICRRYQEHANVVPILEATSQPHDFTHRTTETT
jgi:site-specific DNA-methyltransferase (adenine-specific)